MGYWPSVRSRWLDIGQVLFLRVYGPRRSWGPYTRKKRTRPISNHLDRTNLVNKGFMIWLSGKFFMRNTAGSPERARWLHLARSGSQSQRAIWFILPARGANHIINIYYLPAGRSVWWKTVTEGLKMLPEAARLVFFTIRTGLSRQITCLFFFSSSKLALQITNKFVYAALVIQWACAPSTNNLWKMLATNE